MRKAPVLTFALTALLAASGCSKVASLFGGGEDLATKKQALEGALKMVEAEATAMAGKLAEVAAEAQAAAPAAGEAPSSEVATGEANVEEKAPGVVLDDVVPDAEMDPDARLKVFADLLGKAGLGPVISQTLLPDLLGGLDACDAPLRTKLHFDKGYATLARYPDAKAADKCLKEYLKMPGAAKFTHLYTLKGAYMLELHPRLEATDMNRIRSEFTTAMKD